jgi:threonylcarbamoyladenosine tRNA methylthiotransferase MtaB
MLQTFHSRAYLKIQDGCDCKCSYCRVWLARGHSQSLAMRTIIERARSLEQAGYREVVLTGVNISSYRDGTGGLAGLLEKLLDMTATVRFRLSSLEPDGIDADLLRAVAAERICPHFHIPVQSGSARLLAAMGRRPEPEKILQTVHLLASARRDPYLAADFITGFPGENEADFQASYDLAAQAGFTDLHVFPFSPRPGTEAAVFTPRIPQRIAGERAGLLRGLAERRLAEYRLRQPGRLGQVLIESVDGDGGRGTSENYLEVRIRGTDPLAIGSLVHVRVIAVEKNSLIGELVKIG